MKNKLSMLFLFLAFLGGIFSLVFFYVKNKNAVSSSLPIKIKITPTPTLSEVTPTPTDPLTQQGKKVKDDLDKLDQDLLKTGIDSRLVPPIFYVEQEILE